MIRNVLVSAALLLGAGLGLSCQVNDYCLNCAVNGDGGVDGELDANLDAIDGTSDAGDGGPCVPTGPEVCDNKDNDCNGQVDDAIADIGTQCTNQTGECAGGVHQCISGVPTCSHAPMPEQCDNKDNDCNGLTDEGDPGGGALCGTNAGECVAGTNRCVNGAIQCVGAIGSIGGMPEACNGLDDDCDGQMDEGLANLGTCGPSTSTGECTVGHLECQGGGPVCKDAVGPTFELCDALDQDCDGNPTNGFNLMTDPRNCGMCNMVCNFAHAVEGCAAGTCTIAGCEAGFVNANGMAGDGCEYACVPQGAEVCNGRDDDCDTRIDEGVTAPAVGAFCRTAGECATGTTVTCGGTAGFVCNYTDPDVSHTGSQINNETLCDNKDNDCDGATDEGQPTKGLACDNGGTGDCRSTGTNICGTGAAANGPAVCNLTTMGPGNTAETCDGRDNNCNGVIDDGAAAGNLPGQNWVTIPGLATQIQQFEASRPDATATNSGTRTAAVCSKQGVLPWTNVTQPQAEAACTAIGARLCSETEWQRMCEPLIPFPAAGPTGTTDFVYLEAEDATANTPLGGKTWSSVPTQDFSGVTSLQAIPDSGTAVTAANALTTAPRLDFQTTLAASTSYAIWVRMLAPGAAGASDQVYVGLNLGTTAGAANATAVTAGTRSVWIWVRGPAITTGTTAGTYTASVYMARDGISVDAIAIVRSTNPTTPPADTRTWAYATNRKTPQPLICNDDDLDTNAAVAGDQDDILTTGALTQCFADGAGANDAFDMSGNVKEWTRERAAGQNPLRGGSANNEVSGVTCNLNFTLADDQFFFPNVGFRCCR